MATDRSYAFYLWHWPVLVIAAQRVGHGLSVGTNLLLLAAAFALSVVSYKLYEKPLRYAQFARKPQAAYAWVSAVAMIFALATSWTASIDGRVTAQNAAAAATTLPVFAATQTPAPAAPALVSSPAPNSVPVAPALGAVIREVNLDARHRALPAVLVPRVGALLRDLPQGIPAPCLASTGQTRSAICRLGPSSSSRTIVLLGDSHAQVWLPDLLSLAQRDHWTVVPLIKEGCSPHQWLSSSNAPYCPPWFRWAMGQASRLAPDVTLIAGSYTEFGPSLNPASLPGMDSAIHVLKKHSSKVVIMGDVPVRHRQPVDCLLASKATPAGCSELLTTAEAGQTEQVAQLAGYDKVGFIDPTGWFCDQQQCPLVIGNAIAYRDDNHISQTYASELTMVFRAAFYAAAGRQP